MSQLNFSIGTFSQCMSFSPQDIKIDNFEDYTLYCIDCENVQQFDTNTLKATSPSVFFFFGNFEKIGQKCWQQIFAIAKDFPNSYCFNTHQSQKNFADIYCATLLGQIPFITDVQSELEAVQKQKEENMALFSFDTHEDDNEEDL